MFRRRVAKRAGGGRGHIEEGRRRLDALGEQSRRREELQQKRRRMRFLPRSSAPCAIGAAHGLRASGSAASWASGARRRRARRRVVVSGRAILPSPTYGREEDRWTKTKTRWIGVWRGCWSKCKKKQRSKCARAWRQGLAAVLR